MLLSACLLSNINPFEYEFADRELLKEPPYNQINFVRKADKEAFNYASTAISLIKKEAM